MNERRLANLCDAIIFLSRISVRSFQFPVYVLGLCCGFADEKDISASLATSIAILLKSNSPSSCSIDSWYFEGSDGYSYFKPYSSNEVFQILGRAGRPIIPTPIAAEILVPECSILIFDDKGISIFEPGKQKSGFILSSNIDKYILWFSSILFISGSLSKFLICSLVRSTEIPGLSLRTEEFRRPRRALVSWTLSGCSRFFRVFAPPHRPSRREPPKICERHRTKSRQKPIHPQLPVSKRVDLQNRDRPHKMLSLRLPYH